MSYPYRDDILAQPAALTDTAQALAGERLDPALRRTAQSRPIVLTGMGSSYWGLWPLYRALRQAGHRVSLVETGELVDGSPQWFGNPVVVAASQSGASAEIVDLVGWQAGRPLIAVTNTADSPLALAADAVALIRAGLEATVATRTYVSTLVAASWLAGELTGRRADDHHRVAAAATAYLADWRGHVTALHDVVRDLRALFLAGRGAARAAAATGALIVKESVQLPAEGMTVPGFRHGPLEMAPTPGTVVIVYEGEPGTAERNRRLVDDITAIGGRAHLAGVSGAGALRLPFPDPVLDILPIQLLTLAVAEQAGTVAGQFRHMSKVTTTA
ncbi:SIS domain-containing protein [Dactylosporangium siamense]|uniref:Glutamine--fructose-6-phosphate aminotransferase [isomerizing] n=1 Tax=Dactylosporangium siamense TaxID=685454 RepID=A0A919PT67_9ACTN|nr:hypothetical protein [Dactylosporangium siamense]GIG50131.1 aminotransferase [Dactylosporangium siamense]